MEPTEATNASTPADDELVDRIRQDNDELAFAELRARYRKLIRKIASGTKAFDALCAELESTLSACVMDYRGRGVFPDLVKTALKRRAIDFHRDRQKRGHVGLRDGDGSGHRELTDDGYSTRDGAPTDDGTVSIDVPIEESESSSAVVLRNAPAGREATCQWTDEDHAKNAAFVDFWHGVSEGALREAARAARVKAIKGASPSARGAAVDESDEAKTARRVSGVEGLVRVILERPYYMRLFDLYCYGEDDKRTPREIERGILEPPVYDDDAKRCPACAGIIRTEASYCEHCRRWLCEKDRPLGAPDGGHHESKSVNAVASTPTVESAKRLLDEAATRKVIDTVVRVARDRSEKRARSNRLPPGPANVRTFAEEAVRGPGKMPSLGALRVRKHREKKRAAVKSGALPDEPPAN